MSVFRHLKAWLRRGRLDEELREELAQHVEWKTERLIAEGVSDTDARRQAAVQVGNLLRLREDSRSVWGFPRLDSLVQDARYGFRQMRRAPGFAAVAVLSLAIGIGASAAVFSLADALLLQKLPVTDPDRLVVLKWNSGPVFPFSSLNGYGQQNADGLASTSFALTTFQSMRSAGHEAIDLFGFADLDEVNVSIDGRAELLGAHAVSGNYFDVLGVPPAAGRPLTESDNRPDAVPAAMISDLVWQRRFGRSPDAVGRAIIVNGIPFTIAGVTRPGFRGTGQVTNGPGVFLPLAQRGRVLRGEERDDDPNMWWVLLMGRVRPGATAGQVQPALDLILKRTVAAAKPDLKAADLPRLQILPGARGQQEEREQMRDPLRTMAVVVSIVLLVACANVANLLLARGRARARELSVRAAIGAPRARVIRQLFTEGAILAICGAALGITAAHWITQALLPALTASPDATTPALDWRLLAFVTVLAASCAIAFALAPAVRSTRVTLTAGLQEARRGNSGASRSRFAGVLVVAQIALSMVLVVTAALLARSLRNLDRVELGFDPHNVLTFRLDPTLNGYDDARVRSLYARVLEGLRASPDVLGVTFTSHPLLANSSAVGVAVAEGQAAPPPGSAPARAFMSEHSVWRQVTGPDFFTTMRLPMRRGRVLDERDAAPGLHTTVVNVRLARQLFKTDEVLGRRFRLGMSLTSTTYEIVGVSADARYTSAREEMPPTAYLAAAQQPPGRATFEIRTSGEASALAAVARDVVRRLDDQLPLVNVRTIEDQLTKSLSQERLFALLAMLLGGVTLGLSAIGLYGLLAYGVAQRVPEIGLRMALGAGRASVRWMVLRQSLVLAAAGLVAGAAGAVASTTLVESMLFELPARDPLTVAGAAVVMLATCVLAGYLPARRAARVDPLVALRAE